MADPFFASIRVLIQESGLRVLSAKGVRLLLWGEGEEKVEKDWVEPEGGWYKRVKLHRRTRSPSSGGGRYLRRAHQRPTSSTPSKQV